MQKTRGIKLWILSGLLAWMVVSWTGVSLATQQEEIAPEKLEELKAAAQGAVEGISQALTQTLFAWDSLERGDQESAVTFAHQAINVIEGLEGEHYDPAYDDSEAGLGDGVGALVHAARLLELLDEAPNGESYRMAAENVVLFLQWFVGNALQALERVEGEEGARDLRKAQAMLMAARGSREEVNRPTEGGARTILAWLEALE